MRSVYILDLNLCYSCTSKEVPKNMHLHVFKDLMQIVLSSQMYFAGVQVYTEMKVNVKDAVIALVCMPFMWCT